MNVLSPLVLVALLSPLTGAQTPCAWQANGNLAVIEVEAAPTAGDWVSETTYAGFTGSSYYRWNGPDYFNTPGMGILNYPVEVHEAGNYKLLIHNRHQHSDDTMENDAWVRMDNGPWIKCFSNGPGTVATWNWNSVFDIAGVHSVAAFDMSVGRHMFQVSGRSFGFMIDRINLYKDSPAGVADVNTPVSPCALGGQYCSSGMNSSGGRATLYATGSIGVTDNNLVLSARTVPSGTIGLFFFGDNTTNVPFGNGQRCIAGQIYRLPTVVASGTTLRHTLDFNTGSAGAINAGSTWHFQAWFRDNPAGGAGFDTSDAMHINFLP